MQIDETQQGTAPRQITAMFEPGEVVAEADPVGGSTMLTIRLHLAVGMARQLLDRPSVAAAIGAAIAHEALKPHEEPPLALDGQVLYLDGIDEVEVPSGRSAVWSRIPVGDLHEGQTFRYHQGGRMLGPWHAAGEPREVAGRVAVQVSAP